MTINRHNSHRNLALGALLLSTTLAARADFTVDFSGNPASEWTGGYTYSPTGPAGWSGVACIQSTDTGGGWANGSTITVNFSYSSGHQPNLWAMDATKAHLSFDLVMDGATSFNANGQWWQLILAANSQNGWTQLEATNGWHNGGDTSLQVYHVDIPFSALAWDNALAAGSGYYQLNFWANSDGGNPIDYYLDNVSVYTAATVAPTNFITKVSVPKGLNLVTSSNVPSWAVGSEQFQRQDIVAATNGFNWYGSPDPVTYSLTITNFPGSTYTNFVVQMYLVDGPTTVNAPDWNIGSVLALAISWNTNGMVDGNLAYKIDAGNSNVSDGNKLGDLLTTNILGTWSLTFSNNDYVTVTAPDGTTLSTNMNSGDSASFQDALSLYVNAQANLPQNIGQGAVISSFQVVSNNVTLFSDNFSSVALNAAKWSVVAQDQAGVFQIPTTAAYMLSWTLPDGGFNLKASSDLSTWSSPGLSTTTVNGQRATFISNAYLDANPVQFFRLSNP
jgi:hypothetical protein